MTVPVLVTPQVPDHLTAPLPAPAGLVVKNRDILALLADYEALRRRANADRAAVLEILDTKARGGPFRVTSRDAAHRPARRETPGHLFKEAPMADKPKYRQTDMAAQVRRVEPEPTFYPTYQFTGRTFVKRDRPGPKPHKQ